VLHVVVEGPLDRGSVGVRVHPQQVLDAIRLITSTVSSLSISPVSSPVSLPSLAGI
jgi:hypothetical protein